MSDQSNSTNVYAMIENGVVINLIVWDGITPYNPGTQYILLQVPDGALVDRGYSWDATNGFTAPAEPVGS
ncbi:hypothetical protein ABK905_09470 [Acerihabitans sp. KWT182]|uniref:Uncharacterized protein n=1 Tax=Acerihabitans sp. KWT182 TaxID=3157919 RepID=A0AAU7QFR0_9GAMM